MSLTFELEPVVSMRVPVACPYCGSDQARRHHMGGYGVCVRCNRCRARGPVEPDYARAVYAWNLRA
jgi:Lar family restriction alleviation protein